MAAPLTDNSKNQQSLRVVVYERVLKSALLPFGGLISIMLALYFWGVYYTYQINLDEMRERAEFTTSEIARNEAASLNQKLKEIRRNTGYLQTMAVRLFKDTQPTASAQDTLNLQRTSNGVFYRDLSTMMDGATIHHSSLPSSIYIAADTPVNDSLFWRLQVTEILDPYFQHTVDSDPVINSIYFNSWNNINRTYPPLQKVSDTYETFARFSNSKSYASANTANNPTRGTLWSDVYLNTRNQNWTLSSIAPVYHQGFLEGVIGVDIPVEDFTASLLQKAMIWNSVPLIIKNNGQVLGVSHEGANLLGVSLPAANADKASAKHNFLKHTVFTSDHLQNFTMGADPSNCCVWLNNEEYLLSQQIITETGWRLVLLTPMNKVAQQIKAHLSFLKILILAFVLLTLAFFTALLLYLKRRANDLAQQVSRPVEEVTNYISRLNTIGNNKPLPAMQVGIRELDGLINSSTEIQLARRRLSQMNEELEQKNHQLEVLATTDRLTGLLNRHKLDQIIEYEFGRAKRYDTHFSLALMDIDHFKIVNDTYGHQVGDSILAGVSSIMKRRVRSTDIVGRWGGEEFIILLPNTPLLQAAVVLDELREQLSRSNFEPVSSLTVSIGLAHSSTYPCEDDILSAADEALYRAKQNGRNRLETEPAQAQQSTPAQLNELVEMY